MEHYEEVFKRMNEFALEFKQHLNDNLELSKVQKRYDAYKNECVQGQYIINVLVYKLGYDKFGDIRYYHNELVNLCQVLSSNDMYINSDGTPMRTPPLCHYIHKYDTSLPPLGDLILAARLEYQSLKQAHEQALRIDNWHKKIEDENSRLRQQVKTLERRIRDTEMALMPEPIEYDYELYASRIAPFKQELMISINALKRIIARRYKDHGEPL